MNKQFLSVRLIFKLACSVICLSQVAPAADFYVADREAVLQLTARIQATQFLTHATFGPTKKEIDDLAVQIRQKGTVQAATEWIDTQVALPPTLHNVVERKMCDDDLTSLVLWKRRKDVNGIVISPTIYDPVLNADPPVVENPPLVAGGPTPPSYDNMLSRTRYRQHAWWTATIGGKDQLRQKTAWALAQIFAVSMIPTAYNVETPSTLVNGQTNLRSEQYHHFMGLTNYYDIFTNGAFSNYRDVLGKVTYSPIMGDWLSFRGNVKATSPTAIVQPDENYAREVMQLFTIGIYKLNDDGTQIDDNGTPAASYTNDDIREYAQIFTGLGYGYTQTGGNYEPDNSSLNKYSPYSGTATTGTASATIKYCIPMRMAPTSHDTSSKVLLGSLAPQILPALSGTNLHTEASANAEIDAALDGLIAYQSCAPFVCHRLIQRTVKTSPSRAYLGRVVAKFRASNGDLKEVVKAILLDPEAFQPIRVQSLRTPANTFRVTSMGTEDSKVQEPLLNYTRFNRFYAPKNANGLPVGRYEEADTTGTNGSFTNATLIAEEFRLQGMDSVFEQSPYEPPNVFNFYYADYKPGGTISNYVSPTGRIPNNDLFAPELQIINAITANTAQNFYRDRLIAGNKTESLQTANFIATTGYPYNSTAYENSKLETAICNKTRRWIVTYDFSFEQSMLTSYDPDGTGPENWGPAGSDTRIDKFLEHLDLYFCGGTLHQGFKDSLKANLKTEVALIGPAGNGFTAAEALDVVKGTMLALEASPSLLITE